MIRQRATVKMYVDYKEVGNEMRKTLRPIVRKVSDCSKTYMNLQLKNLFYFLHPTRCIKDIKCDQDGFSMVFTVLSRIHNDTQVKLEAYMSQDGITSFTSSTIKKNNTGVNTLNMLTLGLPY